MIEIDNDIYLTTDYIDSSLIDPEPFKIQKYSLGFHDQKYTVKIPYHRKFLILNEQGIKFFSNLNIKFVQTIYGISYPQYDGDAYLYPTVGINANFGRYYSIFTIVKSIDEVPKNFKEDNLYDNLPYRQYFSIIIEPQDASSKIKMKLML